MAIDSAAKRWSALAISVPSCRLPIPTGNNLDLLSERYTALGIYGGFTLSVPSIGASSGARQRLRRIGLIARV